MEHPESKPKGRFEINGLDTEPNGFVTGEKAGWWSACAGAFSAEIDMATQDLTVTERRYCSGTPLFYRQILYGPIPRYSPVYGSRAMKRARLMALVTACWLAALQPVLRRPTIRPWRLISFFSNSTSL